jgi:hypothetical protein
MMARAAGVGGGDNGFALAQDADKSHPHSDGHMRVLFDQISQQEVVETTKIYQYLRWN